MHLTDSASRTSGIVQARVEHPLADTGYRNHETTFFNVFAPAEKRCIDLRPSTGLHLSTYSLIQKQPRHLMQFFSTAENVVPMPFTYTIEPENNVIHTRGEGSITLDDLDEHMKTVANDPLFRPGMNTIADLRNARIMMTLLEAPDLVRLFIRQVKIRKRGSWAVVVNRYPEAHLIRFFITFMEHLPFQMSVFEKREDAIQWIHSACADHGTPPEQR